VGRAVTLARQADTKSPDFAECQSGSEVFL
jgi:hypothetical protein